MEAKTSGAWLVHHSIKLQQITGSQEFNTVSAAGKAGTLLSALSSNDQTTLSRSEVEALAEAANINVLWELNPILERLKHRSLIDVSNTGVALACSSLNSTVCIAIYYPSVVSG
jgi:hypothetical protein